MSFSVLLRTSCRVCEWLQVYACLLFLYGRFICSWGGRTKAVPLLLSWQTCTNVSVPPLRGSVFSAITKRKWAFVIRALCSFCQAHSQHYILKVLGGKLKKNPFFFPLSLRIAEIAGDTGVCVRGGECQIFPWRCSTVEFFTHLPRTFEITSSSSTVSQG